MTCFPPRGVTSLLIDTEVRNLPSIFHRLTRAFEAAPPPLGEVTVSGGGTYPQTATGVIPLLQQAVDLMARAKQEGGTGSAFLRDPR